MFQGGNCTVYALLCIVYPTYYTLFIESTVLDSNQCFYPRSGMSFPAKRTVDIKNRNDLWIPTSVLDM